MKQTVTSKYEPKSKNVTWIDMSSGSPILKNFINGMWRPTGGSGGGAGSTNPTEADATKVWQVTPVQKGTKTEEIALASQQMMNIDIEDLNSCILQNTNNLDKFVNGAKVIAVIDGTEYEGTVEQGGGWLGVLLQEEQQIAIMKVPAEVSPTGEDALALRYQGKHEVSVNVVEETTTYDYNWAPGVKIPIPTAEDESKILVVTKTEGDTSIIVPEQPVPADNGTPLTNVDLAKFIVGNTVMVTISENSKTFTETGVIEKNENTTYVAFSTNADRFDVLQVDNLLYTSAGDIFSTNSTIKLEYVELNYEYQLQENSGGENTSVKSNIFPFIALARFATEEEQTKYNLTDETYVLDYPKEVTIPPYAVLTSYIDYSSEWIISDNKIVFNRYGSGYEDGILTIFNLDHSEFERIQYNGQWCDLFKVN